MTTRSGTIRVLFLLTGCALAAAAVLAVAAPASAQPGTTTCSDFLPPGSYGHVVVPDGDFCFSFGPVMIGNGLSIGAGSTFLLGGDEGSGIKVGSIFGGVTATNPANVQIHNATIIGGLSISGGSGPFGGPFDITWNAIEDNTIIGGVTIDGYDGFWMGFIRNHVSGNVNLTNNVLVDEDGNEYVTNSIHGDLNCSGNDPAPQVGDSEGSPNLVYGFKTGQCVGL
jgi:hypothetical protein